MKINNMKGMLKENKMIIILILTGILLAGITSAQSYPSSAYSSGYSQYQTGNFNSYNSASFSGSYGSSYRSVTTQYYQPSITSLYSSTDIGTYWPILTQQDETSCIGRQDFIVQIAPAGCQPAVVRSDILEEQNVPVFCKLNAVKLNPLIDVKSIDRIVPSISGSYPPEIAGVGYYPARAALRSYDSLLGSPLINDVGHLVVVLKQNPVEKSMPDYVSANFTAALKYDMGNAWGVGRSEYYLPQMTENEWQRDYKMYEFWNGKGYLKLEGLEGDRAVVSVYRDFNTKISTLTLERGKVSDNIYLPGFYCMASLQLSLNDIASPEASVILQVNDDKIELRKNSRFYNNKCYVASLDADGGSGRTEIVCNGERKVLSLEYADVYLKVDDALSSKFGIGSRIKTISKDNAKVYLAYSGMLPEKISPNREQFVVLARTADEQAVYERNKGMIRTAIENKVKDFERRQTGNVNELVNEIKNLKFGNYALEVLEKGKDYEGIRFEGGTFSDVEYKSSGDYGAGTKVDDYFNKAVNDYRDVANKFPAEKIPDTGNREYYGERALFKAGELADYAGKKQTARELWQELVEKYPNSARKNEAETKIRGYASLNADAGAYLFKTGINIKILEFRTPNSEDASAEIRLMKVGELREQVLKLSEGGYIVKEDEDVNKKIKRNYVTLRKLNEGAVTIDYDCSEKILNSKGEIEYAYRRGSEIIQERNSFRICDNVIYIDKVNLKQVAKVSVIPNIKNTESQVNVSFKIGIEKRAIKLSTDKTKEMIDNLNKTIKKWEDINKKLGEGVKAMKGACFATSAFLQVKTLLEGFGGKSMARASVMRGEGGWMQICEEAVSSGQLKIGNSAPKTASYASIDDCLHENSKEIEKSVSYIEKKINEQNKIIQGIEAPISKSDDFGLGKTVNTEKSRNDYFNSHVLSVKNNLPTGLKDSNGNDIDMKGMLGRVEANKDLQASLSYEDMKDIRMNSGIYNDNNAPDEIKAMAGKKLVSVFEKVSSNIKAIEPAGANSVLGVSIANYNDRTGARMYEGKKASDLKIENSKIDGNLPVQAFSYNNKNYVAVLNSLGGGRYNVKEFYELNGNRLAKVGGNNLSLLNQQVANFQKLDSGSYKNQFKIKPSVKYWETEPYKGMPAFVPVDVSEGWYAATKQTLPSFGNIKAYEGSGRVSSFWLCNVGANGIAQFDSGIGDDICEQINLNTGQPVNLFPGLSKEKASQLIDKAQRALMQAAEQYSSGVKRVNVLGENYDVGIPATGKLGTQCQDFMSPDDCYLLFNVCDPVICPTSRCNLGGNYYVDDVVQSGIIGSIALCLPNIKEGIFVPVCLTGVHAGLESYVSILKAHRDCLSESLKSGKHIGICDEIYSIYLCEFFWRQLAPVLNILIPKMVELAYGQGTRGGGEYLTVQNAWNNMEKSVSYFTSYYAANSMKAFQIRGTEEVGTEVCKAFVSTKYPNLKLLLEPDSPSQFYAWFSEIPYTDATVPATSQYKVFYHIYAGKDSGTYYSVYLRNPPGTSFYQSNPTVTVATGYIGKGEYADETKDFTAPVGYKELCVRINDKDNCGFKQVSSDFAVNYIKDKYVAEQGAGSVTSEKECVSGTPSLYTMANPNVQAGLEETGTPSIYNRGITRICSTDNPGKTSEPGRWKDVGYCDDTKVRCWIDTQDVKDNIVTKNLRNETLIKIDSMNVQNQIDPNYGNADSLEISKTYVSTLRENVDDLNKVYGGKSLTSSDVNDLDVSIERMVSELDLRYDRAIFNEQKVQFLLMKAELYDSSARILLDKFNLRVLPVSGGSGSAGSETKIISDYVEVNIDNNEGICSVNVSDEIYGIDIADTRLKILQDGGWKDIDADIAVDKWKYQLQQELMSKCKFGEEAVGGSGVSGGCVGEECKKTCFVEPVNSESEKKIVCVFASVKEKPVELSAGGKVILEGFPDEITVTMSSKFEKIVPIVSVFVQKKKEGISGLWGLLADRVVNFQINNFGKRASDRRWVGNRENMNDIEQITKLDKKGNWRFVFDCSNCDSKFKSANFDFEIK